MQFCPNKLSTDDDTIARTFLTSRSPRVGSQNWDGLQNRVLRPTSGSKRRCCVKLLCQGLLHMNVFRETHKNILRGLNCPPPPSAMPAASGNVSPEIPFSLIPERLFPRTVFEASSLTIATWVHCSITRRKWLVGEHTNATVELNPTKWQ